MGFFVAAMVCHGELARDRPPARSLTEFYLLISLGGALGGVFNAIVAPALFDSLVEYPLAIVLAALCLPRRAPRIPPTRYARWLDFGLPLAFGATVALIVSLVGLAGSEAQVPGKMVAFGMAAGIAVNFVRRPLRFGLAVGAIALAVALAASTDEQELHQERSFFGVYRVTATQGGDLHELVHGTTTHGRQDLSPALERTAQLLPRRRPDRPTSHRRAAERHGQGRDHRARDGFIDRLLQRTRRAVDLLRDRSHRRADRARSPSLHLPARLPRRARRGAR